jgi:feruloyl esterase
VTAKAVVRAFYGEGPKFSYFSGCSFGGRQALTEVQRYPDDYDGVIAGAPAVSRSSLLSTFVWVAQALSAEPGSPIPEEKLPAIEAAAVAACDTLDGLKDGLISDPTKCHFDPESLRCKGLNQRVA